jgi:hypothetical protein
MASLPAPLQSDRDDITAEETATIWHSLSDLQQAWLMEWLSNGHNAMQAAKDAGYQCRNDNTYKQVGHENRHHEKIAELIRRSMERHMGEGECMSRLEAIAKGSMEDFLRIDDQGQPQIDLDKAKRRGQLHLIKKIRTTTRRYADGEKIETKVDLQLYSKQRAIEKLLDAHGAFTDADREASRADVTINQWVQQINNHLEGGESAWPHPDDTNEIGRL